MKKVFFIMTVFFTVFSWEIATAPLSMGAETTITLSWSDYAAPTYDQVNYIKYYIKRIAEETKGHVNIKLYPNQQLVKALQQYEAMTRGTIDMCNFTPAYYAGKAPLLTLSSETSFWKPGDVIVIASRTAQEIDQSLTKDNIKYLGWGIELPPLCFIGNKIFRNSADFKGMKIRAPGKFAEVINTWGGTGVSIPASESYLAMQTGVVDGLYTTIGSVEGSRIWEVASSMTLLRVGGNAQYACMNLQKWNSLPDSIKKSFEKVNREMASWGWKHAIEYTTKTEEFLKPKFKNWYKLTETENRALHEKIEGFLYKPVVERFGEPAQKIWDKTLAIAKECDEARMKGKTVRFFED